MKKRVVVIGGGFAGTCVAQELQREFAVTLIDSKSYFEFTPGILRTIVEPKHWRKIRVLHRVYLPNCRIVIGVVFGANEHEVCIGMERIAFDYLVICSGSSYNAPIKEQRVVLPVRARHLVNASLCLEKATTVLIVGGGLVGVELAAEIVTHFPQKQITIIHPHEFLMERNLLKSQLYAASYLEQRGVRILYRDRIMRHDHGTFMSERGLSFTPDLAFLCTGITPNFSFLDDGLRQALDGRGYVRVNKHMQVRGFNNIFAAGDITNVAVEKTAQNAERQAKIVAANIHALERGKALHAYEAQRTPQVISLGKWNGIFEINGKVITGIVPAFLKMAIERREMWRRGRVLI